MKWISFLQSGNIATERVFINSHEADPVLYKFYNSTGWPWTIPYHKSVGRRLMYSF